MTDIQHEHSAAAHEAGRLPGVGEMLRGAREARGESVLDVAHALKLSPRQVEAIELERFDQLPGPAFVRGFMRNYARYLGIEAEPLIAGLRRDTPTQAVRLAPVKNASGAMPHGTAAPHKMLKPAAAIVVVMAIALGLGAYFDWFRVADTQPLAPETGVAGVAPPMREAVVPSVAAPRVIPAPESAAHAGDDTDTAAVAPAQGAPTDANDAAAAGAAGDGDAAAASVKAPAEVAESSSAAATSVSEAPKPPGVATDTAAGSGASGGESAATPERTTAAPATTAAADSQARARAQADGAPALAQLVFRLAGESWIQVRDKSGSVVYTGIGAPESTRTVQGEPPFAIVIGNATQVSLEYDGRPVDLAPHTRSGGVARMTLE
ncbi:MAG TPA: DUF4115 domain-containing protein [Rhodocyclaceae bacterium]|nr:DUF4115 domain-containing protein [Rhodocyclaceae bacterium]